jgi:hypothetical protein
MSDIFTNEMIVYKDSTVLYIDTYSRPWHDYQIEFHSVKAGASPWLSFRRGVN